MPSASFTERIAEYFQQRPGCWVDSRDLERVGGRMAWRTRVSQARREFGMRIDNRFRKVRSADGQEWTVSEYMFVPKDDGFRLEA